MSIAKELLSEIETFCRRFDVAETTFGIAVARDGHLVRRLRETESITAKRIDRVREYIAEQTQVRSDGNHPSDGGADRQRVA